MKFPLSIRFALVAALGLTTVTAALADIRIGVVLSTTGPAASLGIPEQKTVALFPKEIGGEKVQYIFVDDASDPTSAVKAVRRLITEDKVHAIIGSTITPNSLAMIDVVADAKVPQIALAAGRTIVFPVDDKRRWVFNTAPTTSLMTDAVLANMKLHHVKSAAFLGFDDAFGEDWWTNFSEGAKTQNLPIVANERYSRNSTSVTGQILHITAAKPDAVLIAASGTPAALPERALGQVGYTKLIYQSGGVANPDFLRVCGADCNGTFVAVAPGLVAEQLPANASIKQSAMLYARTYEAAYGKNTLTQFSANAWDSGVLLEHAIPVALKHAKPDDVAAFRSALRDALEGLKDVPAAGGVYTMSPTNHNGLDERGVAMVKIDKGAWKLVQWTDSAQH